MTAPTDEEVRKIAERVIGNDNAPHTGPIATENRERYAAFTAPTLARWCLDRLSAGSGWRPISEYDQEKPSTAVLGYFGNTSGDEPPDMAVVSCVEGEWSETTFPDIELDEPTHFHPLPSPPGEG